MLIVDIPQGSDEWLTERAGNVSASNFHKIVTGSGKATTGKTRETYLYKLAAERITGKYEATFKNDAMERGNLLEDEARSLFEERHGLFVAQVGLIYLDEARQISASPDGLILDNSGVEIKCPLSSTHIRYLDRDELPSIYKQQVQGCMWVAQRETWHFMSYHPDMMPFVKQVHRDDEYIKKLSDAVLDFNNQLNELVEKIASKRGDS